MSIGYHWDASPLNHIAYGPLKPFNSDEDSERFSQALHAAVPKYIFSTNWVTISGTEYRTGLVICVEDGMPVFC